MKELYHRFKTENSIIGFEILELFYISDRKRSVNEISVFSESFPAIVESTLISEIILVSFVLMIQTHIVESLKPSQLSISVFVRHAV